MCIRLYLCVCVCVKMHMAQRLQVCVCLRSVYVCIICCRILIRGKYSVYINCCKTAECQSQQRKMSHSTPHVTNYHNPTLILFYKKPVYKQLGLGRSKCLETVGLGYIASTLRNSEVVILRNFIFKQTNMSNKYYQ